MLGSIITVARRMIRSRDPDLGPLALAVAAATVSYFVLLFLFDVSSFPHVPYIMFSLAGLLAAGEGGQPASDGVAASLAGPEGRTTPGPPGARWGLPVWNPKRVFVG